MKGLRLDRSCLLAYANGRLKSVCTSVWSHVVKNIYSEQGRPWSDCTKNTDWFESLWLVYTYRQPLIVVTQMKILWYCFSVYVDMWHGNVSIFIFLHHFMQRFSLISIKILSPGTDRSDQGLLCLPFHLHLWMYYCFSI